MSGSNHNPRSKNPMCSLSFSLRESYRYINLSVPSQQVLREVKVLAHLSHSNVVGYHAAWLEYVTTENADCALPSELTLLFVRVHSRGAILISVLFFISYTTTRAWL